MRSNHAKKQKKSVTFCTKIERRGYGSLSFLGNAKNFMENCHRNAMNKGILGKLMM